MVEKTGAKTALTKDARRCEGRGSTRQMDLFSEGAVDAAAGTPHWRDLPQDAQAALIGLMTQLMLDHARGHRWPEASHDL
jgi:hypothetical protein